MARIGVSKAALSLSRSERGLGVLRASDAAVIQFP